MHLRFLAINSFKELWPMKMHLYPWVSLQIQETYFLQGSQISKELTEDKITDFVGNVDGIIYGGMAVVQLLQGINPSVTTFKEMADAFWWFILLKVVIVEMSM